ncbi:MAG: thiolase family protein [Deltaproteobacteria bacterium]|nr:thiolase family protein [Deltaproteobacteria bacterium]
MARNIVFVGAKRTAFGAFGGSLKDFTATDLGIVAAEAALKQNAVEPACIDHVIFGNVFQTSAHAAALARHVGIRCGIPISVPAVTVNRLCGSGIEAICQAARLIRTEEATTVLAGGAENMSQCPYVLRGARFGYRMNHAELEDSLVAGLYDPQAKLSMALSAELLATQYGVTRQQCDEVALRSHHLAAKAAEEMLQEEIAPVSIRTKNGEKTFQHDEHVRKDATLEALSQLRPVFKTDGVVTAGNASGISDGAAALILSTEEKANSRGWNILGQYIDCFVIGCEPKLMGLGPILACEGLLKKQELSLKDISFIEIHEAFAPIYVTAEKELNLDRNRTNVDGGAIAFGHPLAASGARMAAHLLYRLRKKGGGLGVGSACIGGGQGIAILVKV